MSYVAMRMAGVLFGVYAFVSACDSHPREAKTPDPTLEGSELDVLPRELPYEGPRSCALFGHATPPAACTMGARLVRSWGPAPLEPVPEARCPMHVRVDEQGGVIAEPYAAFDPLPVEDCVPPKFQLGQRRVVRVDDGYLVAYAGAFDGDVYWEDPTTFERTPISSARFVGFARAPSGTILGLGVGRARLGLGGVVAFEHRARGQCTTSRVTSAVSTRSRVRPRASCIWASNAGSCASFRRDRPAFREEWWSARDGASGHWGRVSVM